MLRYMICFNYDGSKFYGYQKQNSKITVQGKLEEILERINNHPTTVYSSGRTDRGVHANNAVAHFDLDNNIDSEKLRKAINSFCKPYIYIKSIKLVSSSFHARFDVKKKEYIYKINIGEYNPIKTDYIYQYNRNLSIKDMKKASSLFVGTKDFKSFTKTNNDISDYTRTIFKCSIKKKKNIVTIKLVGNGFLRYMVRNIVGVLLEVGEGKLTKYDINQIILAKDRTKAKKTAPAQGLYLNRVFY